MPKIQTKHTLASLGAAAVVGGAFIMNGFSSFLPTNAIGDTGERASVQVAAFVQQCNKALAGKLTTCLAAATTRPGVRKCLDEYWKTVNACVIRSVQNEKTGSGRSMNEQKPERPTTVKPENFRKDPTMNHGDSDMKQWEKESSANRPSSAGENGKKPPVTRPKTTQKPDDFKPIHSVP